MKRNHQLIFEKLKVRSDTAFGGSLLKNSHAKGPRPISTKQTMHVVLRVSEKVTKFSFVRSKTSQHLHNVLERQSKLHGVKLYKVAQAHNHIHLILLPRTRRAYLSFIRSVCGLIPRYLHQDANTKMENPNNGFWAQRPWSRLISWGQDYIRVKKYLELNLLEAFGFIPYQGRVTRFNTG
jgi:REP element-mobilizing transposase RayT